MVINNLRAGKKISLFKDVYYTPILVEPLVHKVHELVEKKAKGIFNVVGDDRISKYDFGLKLAREFNLDNSLIEDGKIMDRPSLVNRPHDMSLSNEKVTNFLGRKMGELDAHISKLKAQEASGLAQELQAL
jgi:dTDP-4-dehydrorhamnose reductase